MSQELITRLFELSDAVTRGPDSVAREFTMRVPAEPKRDADLVLSTAARLIEQQAAEIERQADLIAQQVAEIARLQALLAECEDDVRYAWINSSGAGRSVRADRLARLKAALAEGK